MTSNYDHRNLVNISPQKTHSVHRGDHFHINFDDLINQRDICELSHFRLEEFLAEEKNGIR